VLAPSTATALFLSDSLAGPKPAASPKAYIGLFGDDAVAVLDRWVYVGSIGSWTVSGIDTATNKIDVARANA
jgi:hypothetical protein